MRKKYLASRLSKLKLKWDQSKVDALWQAVEEINKQYGVQIDPRFLLAIIIHEGTGSFNTSSTNRAADGQHVAETNYAVDLMKANSLVFGKILGYIYYGNDFKQVVANNKDKSGINGNGEIAISLKNIAQGINLPSYNFVADQNDQDYRDRPNGNWTIIGKIGKRKWENREGWCI